KNVGTSNSDRVRGGGHLAAGGGGVARPGRGRRAPVNRARDRGAPLLRVRGGERGVPGGTSPRLTPGDGVLGRGNDLSPDSMAQRSPAAGARSARPLRADCRSASRTDPVA